MKLVPPIVRLITPPGTCTVIVPVVVSLVSPPLSSPRSRTVAWPGATLLPSSAEMVGAPGPVPALPPTGGSSN